MLIALFFLEVTSILNIRSCCNYRMIKDEISCKMSRRTGKSGEGNLEKMAKMIVCAPCLTHASRPRNAPQRCAEQQRVHAQRCADALMHSAALTRH